MSGTKGKTAATTAKTTNERYGWLFTIFSIYRKTHPPFFLKSKKASDTLR